MDLLHNLWELLTNLDQFLTDKSAAMGAWFYVVLFVIVFCETGLVVMPFLPGDSLLFGLGILAAQPGATIDPWVAGSILTVAALCGDNTNYWIGRSIGPRIFTSTTSRFLNREHLFRAQHFYEKHGPKTIVLARFIAIIRTFAPFVAGIGRMDYRRFLSYSVAGAVLWVWGFVLTGYWLGNWPPVRDNFNAIVWAIMGLTVVLVVVEMVKARRRRKAAGAGT